MPGPADPIDEALFDTLAEVTMDPSLTGLAELMEDQRLRVPSAVRNVVRDREEAVPTS
jgi:hypothetical protein